MTQRPSNTASPWSSLSKGKGRRPMFEKILIANRGEIALRIHRACREMGIRTVAVHSTADSEAMHVRLADESVCLGPPSARDSYLNKVALLSAATITGADAIHPGYGFLSENADFAEMVVEHGFTFIGPSPAHIRMMGDKITAKRAAQHAGLPIVPGSDGAVQNEAEALALANEFGYPILFKATAGGGGRGMKVATCPEDLVEAFRTARAEAGAAFGNSEVYMEKYLQAPRHIEVQVLGDSHGGAVHLGERDCSLQRKHQKVLEEARSPALNEEQRETIGETARRAVERLGYTNAGTMEFLYENGQFYFIEMNTRLQVEHPVTEMITGIDLVREQIRIAAGAPLGYTQKDIRFQGHAIECRVNAEDPETFAPSPGRVTDFHQPGGMGVRVDSGLYQGVMVPPHYDSMVAKLIVHGASRNECLMRLRRALDEFVIEGIHTTLPLHRKLMRSPTFLDGAYDIHWLEHFVEQGGS
ncbi:Acetyl-CoA carboxylase, biotin carboxylase [Pararhodospirillum photometricum DSM 122]|uniref:Biotin carboxylase n=2 Tax=Pararhodospirillum photometricum TaxID=1084 RepID=H6SRS3_PARPM|nr:Acetyl-CoA carboxylase, biotin carboxylase [Pararhodospirillum photometricum DSM 122]